jgi:hypothetical protein
MKKIGPDPLIATLVGWVIEREVALGTSATNASFLLTILVGLSLLTFLLVRGVGIDVFFSGYIMV